MATPFTGTVTLVPELELPKLVFDDPIGWRQELGFFANKRVDVTLASHRDTRSKRANAYYWSVVLGTIARETGHSADEIHEAMCRMFIKNEPKQIEFFSRMTGEVLTFDLDTRRSSKLAGAPFYDFVEQVRAWALDFLGVATEDPDPDYWRKRLTHAK